jgi:hypothetical protein
MRFVYNTGSKRTARLISCEKEYRVRSYQGKTFSKNEAEEVSEKYFLGQH